MGTHPIFESDFDCQQKYVCPYPRSSAPSTNPQGLCPASNRSPSPGEQQWRNPCESCQRLRHGLHFLLFQKHVARCQALRGARWPLNEAPYLLRSTTLIFNLPPYLFPQNYFESITFQILVNKL